MATITCGTCGKTVDTTTTKAGTPALPFKWVKEPAGIICRDCKKQNPVPTLNYVYGAKAPQGESLTLIAGQMRLAAGLRNAFVELEQSRRGKTDAALATANAELAKVEQTIAEAETNLETTRAAIRAGNAAGRKKTMGTPEQREAVSAALSQRATAVAERKRIRAEMFAAATTKAVLATIEAENNAATKRVYAEYGDRGLYWGSRTYLLQIHSNSRKGAPPEFVRYRGDGHIAVQLQGGLTGVEVMACEDTQFRIRSHHDHQTKPHATVSVRVGSTDKGKPIWADFQIRHHRPIPTDALVKMVHVIRRREAYTDHWSLVLSVANVHKTEDRAEEGTVGVDVGWRRLPCGGLRVAAISGSDGHEEELVIPKWQVDERLKADDIASIRDKLFDKVHTRLVDWMATHPLPATWTEETPDNRHPIAAGLRLWESQHRLRRLVLHWEQNRLPDDAVIWGDRTRWRGIKDTRGTAAYAAEIKAAAWRGELLAWLIEDRHLAEYQAGLVRGAINRRTELFRQFALKLRRRYSTAHVEDIDWREEILKKPPAEADVQAAYLRRLYATASPGSLVGLLTEQMRTVKRVDPVGTTSTCSVCKSGCKFNQAVELVHTCETCGVTWDQDFNAARNLLGACHATGQ